MKRLQISKDVLLFNSSAMKVNDVDYLIEEYYVHAI